MVIRKGLRYIAAVFMGAFLFLGLGSLGQSVVYASNYNTNAYQTYIQNGSFNSSGVTDDVIDGFFSETNGGTSREKREVQSVMYGESGEKVDQYSQCSEESKLKVKSKISQIASDTYTKAQVNQVGVDFNVRADLATAGTALSGVRPFISTLMGVVFYLITSLVGLYTAFDIFFITIPTFRFHIDNLVESGGKLAKDTKDGGTKFRFVTDEAIIAVKLCTIESGKNPLAEYMKRRIWALMVLGLAIFLIVTGNVNIFINMMINFASGAIEMFTGLGA